MDCWMPKSTMCSSSVRTAAAMVLMLLIVIGRAATADDRVAEEFFESRVRPLLIDKCGECHNPEDASGGLAFASRESLLKGGEHGAAIVPERPQESLLIKAVEQSGDLKMPPNGKLTDQELEILRNWIQAGAPWPTGTEPLVSARHEAARSHWAFQPVREPNVPHLDGKVPDNAIDAFILQRVHDAGLTPAPEADRRTLIRRLHYTLTGLPPAPDEVDAFINDSDPQAYEKLVDALLESPHYGEHWGRHWLDLARYSDTKGYVYAREERVWTHAWTYRDWVVRALNSDMPYDRFLLLQIAADQVPDRQPDDLAAMGFLTLGRRFLGVPADIIDDRIDVLCRGTMALTVGCARCHDHKYDPIPMADYYSLYGVFGSSAERLVLLDGDHAADEAFTLELNKRREALENRRQAIRKETADRVRGRVRDYLHAQTELDKYPAQGFDQIFEKEDMLPAFVRRWELFLRETKKHRDPVFVAWHAYRDLKAESFAEEADQATAHLTGLSDAEINPLVREAFAAPPRSFNDVIDTYARLFTSAKTQWEELSTSGESQGAVPERLPDESREQLRRVLYGPDSPCEVPDQPIVHIEAHVDSAACNELWKLQGEVDRWIINAGKPVPTALTLIDKPVPETAYIFKRGNAIQHGPEVSRHFLSMFAAGEPVPFTQGSGRWELAQAIVRPDNPLTARVIVNRVWARHFGTGLVDTPGDFGLRAHAPSHPELLDWLATQFLRDGWSLKALHRRILTSATYRQSSADPSDRDAAELARKLDPDNRLLSRMNRHRLTFEEFRDSTLAATGELDRSVGGKPANLFSRPYPQRRTLYGLVDRQFLPSTLRVFDFANPDLVVPARSETTVPQQSLFSLNDKWSIERCRSLADAARSEGTPDETIRNLFRRVLQRDPTPGELQDAREFLSASQDEPAPIPKPTAQDWHYGYGTCNETKKRVDGFTPLPHFNGSYWSGGPNWPDAKLGWVQLTATGGHPGNDRAHASVRRWIAPRGMTVSITSKLVHEPDPGDGVRAFVVGPQGMLIASAKVHKSSAELNGTLSVAAGDAIDFVVDIDEILNSDQYLWEVTISETAAGESGTVWNSKTDFPEATIDKLNSWAQLAQVLLCTNEFLFVD